MVWTTILPIILLSVPGALLGAYVLLADWRRRRTPPELSGEWWSQFEREFRAYADGPRAAAGPRRLAAKSVAQRAIGGIRPLDLTAGPTDRL